MLGGAQQRYSGGAILLHWLLALLLAGELALGFGMPRDPSGFELYQLHKSIGITILVLTFVRLGWRLTHSRPLKLEGGINGFLASAVHVGFYAFMIAMPLSGWALVSTNGPPVPTILFGVVPLANLPLSRENGEIWELVHEYLAWGGIALFLLHVAGALRHHVLLHDRLLERMSPVRGKGGPVLLLLLAVLGLGGAVYFGASSVGPDAAAQPEVPPSAAEQDGRTPLTSATQTPDAVASGAAEEEDIGEDAAEAEEAEAEPEADATEAAEAAGPPPSWTIQPGGTLAFNVDNGGMALNGSFSRWSGTIAMDPEVPESARIAIEIDLSSAALGDGTQDAMLKGPDFLGAGANPTATWRSTSVRRVGGNRYSADGTLSLKGVSRTQRIAFTLSGSGARRSVSGTATIDRKAFNVGTGEAAASVSPTVNVSFAFDATR